MTTTTKTATRIKQAHLELVNNDIYAIDLRVIEILCKSHDAKITLARKSMTESTVARRYDFVDGSGIQITADGAMIGIN